MRRLIAIVTATVLVPVVVLAAPYVLENADSEIASDAAGIASEANTSTSETHVGKNTTDGQFDARTFNRATTSSTSGSDATTTTAADDSSSSTSTTEAATDVTSTTAAEKTTTTPAAKTTPTTKPKTTPTTSPATTPTTKPNPPAPAPEAEAVITGNACPCTVSGVSELKGTVNLKGDLIVDGGVLVARAGVKVNQIWDEAKTEAADAAGDDVDWDRVIRETSAQIHQEFSERLAEFVAEQDAEQIAATLYPTK